MSCAAFEERIAGYVGGDLPAEEAWAVEQHLRSCADCAELARGLEEDREWLASRPPETAGVDYSGMRRAIRQRIARPRHGWKWVAAAAAILLAVGVSLPRRSAVADRSLAVAAQTVPAQTPVPAVPTEAVAKRRTIQKARPAQTDLTLEAAIRMFQELEPPPPPDGSDSPVEMRIATRDPNITIIMLQESNGDSK